MPTRKSHRGGSAASRPAGEFAAPAGVLRLLLVEDSPDDAELTLLELKRAGLDCLAKVVDREQDYRRELEEFSPDVILSDFSLPAFGGMASLEIARATRPEVPFIFLSGTMGEESAIRALTHGATDYILKGNMARLPSAIVRAASEAKRRAAIREAEQARRESEARYRELIEQSSDGIFLTDGDGYFLFANPRLCEMLNYDSSELLHLNVVHTYVEQQDREPKNRDKALREAVNTLIERGMRRKDGSSFPAEISVRALDNGCYQGVARDVTTRRQAEEKIARLNRVQALLSGISSAIVRLRSRDELFREVCRLAVETGRFRLAWIMTTEPRADGPAAAAWHGKGEDFIPLLPLDTNHAQSLPARALREGTAAVANDVTKLPSLTLRREALKRGFHAMLALPLVVAEQPIGVLTLCADTAHFFDAAEVSLLQELAGNISFALEDMEKDKQLKYLAYYDSLTGLANRDLFGERLAQFVSAANRGSKKLAVVYFDIDHFKAINDSLGWKLGDELLKQLAERLSRGAGDPEEIARITADRFAVILVEVEGEADAAQRTERLLRECFAASYLVREHDQRVSAKAGVAIFPDDGTSAAELLKNVEAALKDAKATGERYLFFTNAMTGRVGERLQLENRLRRALEREEFVLHYQPKMYSATGRVQGVEALIRWNSPELGLVPPGDFIPLLEQTGLILEVGEWALRRAVLDHCRWVEHEGTAPRIAVNVSPLQLRQRQFVKVLRSALLTGASPPAIDLEITESLIMEDIEQNIEKLKELRGIGVSVAIDDFGTGYSSLSYLAKLPVETLKIDHSFIMAMLDNPNAMTLVSTMISLAHSFHLKVVAEGVETEQQAGALRQLKCDQLQGYLFSRPAPLEQTMEFVRQVHRHRTEAA